jgi:hypothetical protein
MARKEADEALVVARDSVNVEQHSRHHETEDDRDRSDEREREEDPADIRPHGMALTRQRRDTTAEPTRLLVEHGE